MRYRYPTEERPYPLLPWLVVIVIILWGVAASTVSGQGHSRIAGELDKTDQLIERARDAAVESGLAKARALVDNAAELQQKARDHFRRGKNSPAEQYTLKAREKALEAIAATRSPEENENAVRRQLERTDRILNIIRERIDDRNGRGRRRDSDTQLESLFRRQNAAWRHFHEHRLRAALKQTLKIREQAGQLGEKTRRFRPGVVDAERSFDRTRDFLDRARKPVIESGLEKNIDMFRRAERRYNQAKEALEKNQTSVAGEHLKICHELLNRALVGLEKTVDPDEVEKLIEKASRRWDRLEGAVIDAGDDRIREMYRQAEQHLGRARSLLEGKKPVRALTQAHAAVEIINRLEEDLE
jgi:hypothetical protein